MSEPGTKNYLRFSRLVIAAVLWGLWAGTVARAAVAFNNFGPGDTFNITSGYTETALAPGQSLAEGFSPTVSGTLDLITIAMSHSSGANDVHLFLADGSSGTPGTVLESWVVTNLPHAGISYSPLKIDSVAQPLLSAGNLYFLYSQEPGDEVDVWNVNSISEQGPYFVRQNSGASASGTHTQGAFRVEVTPIPEPASVTLFLGMGLMAALKVRGRSPGSRSASR